MKQYLFDAKIKNGYLRLERLPIKEDMDVKVVLIPKANLDKFSFQKVKELTKNIKGNLSDDITSEREAS